MQIQLYSLSLVINKLQGFWFAHTTAFGSSFPSMLQSVRKAYLYDMEQKQVNFNLATIGKDVEAFVRSRASRLGSFIVYEENGKIIKEDPRTGQKTVLQSSERK